MVQAPWVPVTPVNLNPTSEKKQTHLQNFAGPIGKISILLVRRSPPTFKLRSVLSILVTKPISHSKEAAIGF